MLEGQHLPDTTVVRHHTVVEDIGTALVWLANKAEQFTASTASWQSLTDWNHFGPAVFVSIHGTPRPPAIDAEQVREQAVVNQQIADRLRRTIDETMPSLTPEQRRAVDINDVLDYLRHGDLPFPS